MRTVYISAKDWIIRKAEKSNWWVQDHRDSIIKTLLALAALALTAAILWGAWGSDEFWPVAVPGTLTGIGTLALASVTYSVLRGDQDDRRRREEREQRDQAAHVYPAVPVLTDVRQTIGSVDGQAIYKNQWTWTVEIDNRSNYPIREVDVIIYIEKDLWESRSYLHPDPGIQVETTVSANKTQQAAHTSETFNFEHIVRWDSDQKAALNNNPPPVLIRFADVEGIIWLRDSNWRLHNITHDSRDIIQIAYGGPPRTPTTTTPQ